MFLAARQLVIVSKITKSYPQRQIKEEGSKVNVHGDSDIERCNVEDLYSKSLLWCYLVVVLRMTLWQEGGVNEWVEGLHRLFQFLQTVSCCLISLNYKIMIWYEC